MTTVLTIGQIEIKIPAPIKIDTNYCWGPIAVNQLIKNDIALHECDSLDKLQAIERDTLQARIKVKEDKIQNLTQQEENRSLVIKEQDNIIASKDVKIDILGAEVKKQKGQKVLWIVIGCVGTAIFGTTTVILATN